MTVRTMDPTGYTTARRLKERGLRWQPRAGDRYVSGVTGLVCLYDGLPPRSDDVFLPRVDDLVEWLRSGGYDYHLQRSHVGRRTWIEPAEFRVDLGFPVRPSHTPPFYGHTLLEAVAAAVLWVLGQREAKAGPPRHRGG